MTKIKILILSLLLYTNICFPVNTPGFGGTVGISINLGTKVNRVGLVAGGIIHYENFQISTFWNVFFSLNGFGPDLRRFESQLNLGVIGSFGPHFSLYTPEGYFFYSPVSNLTGYKHSASYVFKRYHDNIGTSQSTGIIGFSIGKTGVYMENDLLIFKGSDKYRTGAISVVQQIENFQFGINSLLWTGNVHEEGAMRFLPDSGRYRSEFGYYDLSKTRYGKISHGILVFQAAYALPYYQTTGIRAGIDAEQIRHVLQNKILHDMPFIPKAVGKAVNPHFPMITEEGEPYLKKEGQKIKRPGFFGDLSLNPVLFY